MKIQGINRDRALDYLSGLSVEIKKEREKTVKLVKDRDGKRTLVVV